MKPVLTFNRRGLCYLSWHALWQRIKKKKKGE